MQQLFLFIVVISGALFGCVFLRFQFKPLRELMPQRGELQSEGTAFFFGVIANVLGIGLYEALVSLKRPAYTALTLTPVSMRTILLGAAIGTIGFISIRMIMRRRRGYPLRRGSIVSLTRAAFVALTVALALELSIFNLRHYDMLLRTDLAPTTVTRGSFELEGLTFDDATQQYSSIPGYEGTPRLTVRFDPTKVHSIQLKFSSDRPVVYASIFVADEAFRYLKKTSPIHLTTDLPRSLYLPVHTVGDSNYFELHFPSASTQQINFRLDEITLNSRLPLQVEISRLLFVFILLFFALLIRPHGLFSRIRFRENDRFQRTVVGCLLALILSGMTWTQFSLYDLSPYAGMGLRDGIRSFTEEMDARQAPYGDYYELVDAFLAGKLNLLENPDDTLIQAQYPYDVTYRNQHNVKFTMDRVFYHSNYYFYFGIVPALVTFLPFRILTGIDLPVEIAHLIFALLTMIGLEKLVRRSCKKFFPDIRFNVFLMSLLGVIAASQISTLIRTPFIYHISIQSGLMFSVWAVYLTLIGCEYFEKSTRSSDDHRMDYLLPFAAAGLFSGLAVGCRPTAMFNLIWVAAILFQTFSATQAFGLKKIIRALLGFIIPLGTIALLLMLYNYMRFGSITEFGFTYQLSEPNESVTSFRTSPSGLFFVILSFLFHPLSFSFEFPFISLSTPNSIPYIGYIQTEVSRTAGIFSFPWFWSLFFLIPNRKKISEKKDLPFILGGTITAALKLFPLAAVGMYFRYVIDFAWILAIVALIQWLQWLESNQDNPQKTQERILFYVFLAMLAITICLSFIGDWVPFIPFNSVQWERLRYLFSFWL